MKFFPATRMRFFARDHYLRTKGCIYRWKIYNGKKIVATYYRDGIFREIKMELHPNVVRTNRHEHVLGALTEIEDRYCEPRDYHSEPHGY